MDSTTSTNSKIGWEVMDFGSVVDNLENAYLWASGGTSEDEQVNAYNVYYSSGAGIDALPAMPKSQGTTGDYDFSSGDWTQIGSTNNLAKYVDGSLSNTVALGGVSAQYIGIEVLSTYGDDNLVTNADQRLAIGQVEFTAVPEPSSLALLGLGGLALLMNRRRRRS
ncbi:MAG: PEP-CTERM sorting domain-containing protein [Lentisphaeria bacterium]